MKKEGIIINKFTLIVFILGLFIVCANNFSYAQVSPDAIAVRVVPNPNHLDAMSWYQAQAFTGSPQEIIVDGYEGIRDGRTVYVNAANVDVAADNLYTNIYLISYNQNAQQPTIDIFSKILKNWKFNTNLPISDFCAGSELSNPGDCSIEPCPAEYTCDLVSNKCKTACLIDSECSQDNYCLSQKAKAARDVRRLADMNKIRLAIKGYERQNNRFPRLIAGTYIAGNSVSAWPSWRETFSNELKITAPVDPINKMGACVGAGTYDPVTCWDADNEQFAGVPENNLPAGSLAYVYTSHGDGEDYVLCAPRESGLTIQPPGSSPINGLCLASSMQYSSAAGNNPPQLTGSFPQANAGEEYEGFANARDADGDSLIWTYNNPGCAGWAWNPLEATGVVNNRRVSFTPAGANPCAITITVDDGRPGGLVSRNFTISIGSSNAPTINNPGNQTVVIGKDLSFVVAGNDLDNDYPLTFKFSGMPKVPSGFNTTGFIEANQHDWRVSGEVEDYTRAYDIKAKAFDNRLTQSSEAAFTVTITNNPPAIDPLANDLNRFTCLSYNKQITASDPNGHAIEFSASGLPEGLYLSQLGPTSAVISGSPRQTGSFTIEITARDEYYDLSEPKNLAEATASYTLDLTNEIFSIKAPADDYIYTAPEGVPIEKLYYKPPINNLVYFGAPTKDTDSNVIWTRIVNWGGAGGFYSPPDNLPLGLSAAIHPNRGEISAMSSSNASAGIYTINLEADNQCGGIAKDAFNLEIRPNAWCGDGVIQGVGPLTPGPDINVTNWSFIDSYDNNLGEWCSDIDESDGVDYYGTGQSVTKIRTNYIGGDWINGPGTTWGFGGKNDVVCSDADLHNAGGLCHPSKGGFYGGMMISDPFFIPSGAESINLWLHAVMGSFDDNSGVCPDGYSIEIREDNGDFSDAGHPGTLLQVVDDWYSSVNSYNHKDVEKNISKLINPQVKNKTVRITVQLIGHRGPPATNPNNYCDDGTGDDAMIQISNVYITTVTPGGGSYGEQCDPGDPANGIPADLGGIADCASLGLAGLGYPKYTGGALACGSDCQFDVANCKYCEFMLNELFNWNGSGASNPEFNQVMMTPMVADLDNDGMPEIVFSTFNVSQGAYGRNNILRVIKGDSGASVFDIVDSNQRTIIARNGIALGNIDNDPELEIISMRSGYCVPPDPGDLYPNHTCISSGECNGAGAVCQFRLIAFEHNGDLKWLSEETQERVNYVTIADVNNDGAPEILSSREVFNNNGTILWRIPAGEEGYIQAVADLNMDGAPEVITECSAYYNNGNLYWSNCGGGYPGFVAIGNFDNDDFPEIVVVGYGKVTLLEHNGQIKWQIKHPNLSSCKVDRTMGCLNDSDCINASGDPADYCKLGGGAPTIADFDNDGQPEIGIAGANVYIVLEQNGVEKWSKPVRDYSSRMTGSTVFDFLNDGGSEVLYNDELYFRIYNGATGEVVLEKPNGSGTLSEYPVVVDVNNDGQSEIVISANDYAFGTHTGIRVFSNANPKPECTWTPTRKIWNQHSYSITNINDDGTIPSPEPYSWLLYNSYRQNR